jgi:hypothetical protein
MAEVLLKRAESEGVPPDEAKAKLREAAQNPMLAAQLQEVVEQEHVPSDMSMDIVLDEIPDTANIQQEQFQVIADLAKAGVPLPPKLLIKASALRNKKELLDELKEAEEAAKNDPMAQEETRIKLEGAMAEIEKMRAEIANIAAETQKTIAEIGKTKAESIERLARADTYDLQIGSVVDPAIVGEGSSGTQSQPQAPMPQATPPMAEPQQPGFAPEPPMPMAGEEMTGGFPPQEMAPAPMMPQPNVPDLGQIGQGF